MKQIKPGNLRAKLLWEMPSCGAEYAAYFGELELRQSRAINGESGLEFLCDYCATCTECGATVAFKER